MLNDLSIEQLKDLQKELARQLRNPMLSANERQGIEESLKGENY